VHYTIIVTYEPANYPYLILQFSPLVSYHLDTGVLNIPQLALSILFATINALLVLACHSHLSPLYIRLKIIFVRVHAQAAVLDH